MNMKNLINTTTTLVTVQLLSSAGLSQAQTFLDWTTLGADVTLIASTAGQTFTNVGGTIGNPDFNGVDLTLKWTPGKTPTSSSPGLGINGVDNLGGSEPIANGIVYYLDHGDLVLTSSTPLIFDFTTEFSNGKLAEGERITFGPTVLGSLGAYAANPDLIVSDDSVENPVGGNTNTINNGVISWTSDPTATMFTMKVEELGTKRAGNFGTIGITNPASVPEPTSAILLGLGVLCLAVRRQR